MAEIVDIERRGDVVELVVRRRPVPRELCRTETATADLREITVPRAVVVDEKVGLDFVVSRVVWACTRCPG